MAADRLFRLALWCAVPLNLLGTALFTSAALGRPPALLPLVPAPFYAAQLALVIGLFGGVYAWLALQPHVNRPLLLVGAIGKVGFFTLFVIYWAVGDVAWPSMLQASPDLMLGLVYLWWLGRRVPIEG